MSFNPEESIRALYSDFQALVSFTNEPTPRTAKDVETHLFTEMLNLSAKLLRHYFESQAAARSKAPVRTEAGVALPYHSRRQRSYFSVFGKITFDRAYFWAPGQAGQTPLDRALALPEDCYSALLCDWAAFTATEQSYGASQALLEHILGFCLPKRAIEQIVSVEAEAVGAFYEAKAPPEAEGSILVVQADGKGVPMRRAGEEGAPLVPVKVRRGKGDKRTQKKEAIVTTLYSIDPYRRTPAEVTAALMRQEPEAASTAASTQARPMPCGKHVWATLAGKDVALADLARQARRRAHPVIVDQVALSDGSIALQQRIEEHFPRFTLVLDVIHATEYLWKAANALLGERDPRRTPWVTVHLEALLSGGVAEVATALEQELAAAAPTAAVREAVASTIGYYRRNAPYMRYDVYLRRGWPIASGVIEGACRHLVKDRMERAGMQWGLDGAQRVLDLRAVRLNGDWSAYQDYRQQLHPPEELEAASLHQANIRQAA
jgi:hypothetical protein